MENSNNNSFWQFSDNLRLQQNDTLLNNLSLNDSIWSNKHERRNFDFRNDQVNAAVNDSWKAPVPHNNDVYGFSGYGSGLNGGFNKGVYSSNSSLSVVGGGGGNNVSYYGKGKSFTGIDGNNNNNNSNNYNNSNVLFGGAVIKGGKNEVEQHGYGAVGGKIGRKNNSNKGSKEGNGGGENRSGVDKRFKTLPPTESLPRNETIGGYIFVCNNDTMAENLKRELFGLPPRYRDSVRAITPGLPIFLYNYSTHQLHGIFEAASFGGSNIDPSAWEDKKNPGESRFPAQVRVATRKVCEPLEEDSFRPILHHYDGPKFRLELNIPEAISLLDIFAENNA